jgi:N-acetylneuraminate lyase
MGDAFVPSSSFRLIPAVFTPFGLDGSLDCEAVTRYADHLHRRGIREVFLNGTTGEGLSLRVEERMAMVETWMDCRDQIEPIVHVGHNCQLECMRMAAHAQEVGCRAISAMSTCFFRPRDARAMVDFLEPIAAAAPDSRFYFYHIPSMTGMPLSMTEFLPLAIERIPNFAGVKYTHENLDEFQQCLERWGTDLEFLFGRDELLLEALARGAQGAVGSFYSLIPNVFLDMAASHRAGEFDSARKLADYAFRYIEAAVNTAPLVAAKFLLAEMGVIGGAVRPPLLALDPEHARRLQHQLEQLGPPPEPSR